MIALAAAADPAGITNWILAGVGVVAAVLSGVFAIVNRRGSEAAKRQPTWAELTIENRALRADIAAATTSLRAAAEYATKRDDDFIDLRREFEDFKDRVEGRDAILVRVLRSAAAQWPTGATGPTFDHIIELDMIGDLMPPAWRNVPPVP